MYAHRYHTLPILPRSVTYRHIVHVQRCVPVIPAVTQPSGGLVFGAVDSGLDTVWTRMGWVALVFGQEGGHGGQPAASSRRKGFVNLFHFLSAPTKSLHFLSDCFIFYQAPTRRPSKAPLTSKSCPYTYGALEGPSRSTQGAVSLISSKKSLPVSE